MEVNRRDFIGTMAGILLSSALGTETYASQFETKGLPIASNQYPWHTFFEREGRNWSADVAASISAVVSSGMRGIEPFIDTPQEVDFMAPLLKQFKLQAYSIYINSTLHESEAAQQSIRAVLAVARHIRPLGTKIFVTNPTPISWKSTEYKTDAQLALQAKNLNELGRRLKEMDIMLAYHNHDVEMRQSAREFHHMMLGTDPEFVKLCLDAHWIYRGAGNSEVALFDIVRLYGKRIAELHLRQSEGGIWKETFSEGDIDYVRLQRELKNCGVSPHLVLEQAVEKDSPHTLDAVSAHVQSLRYAKKIFTAR